MKKYTIVYGYMFRAGSHSHSITKYDRVETDDLKSVIAEPKYDNNIWFIFEGHPKLEGE